LVASVTLSLAQGYAALGAVTAEVYVHKALSIQKALLTPTALERTVNPNPNRKEAYAVPSSRSSSEPRKAWKTAGQTSTSPAARLVR